VNCLEIVEAGLYKLDPFPVTKPTTTSRGVPDFTSGSGQSVIWPHLAPAKFVTGYARFVRYQRSCSTFT